MDALSIIIFGASLEKKTDGYVLVRSRNADVNRGSAFQRFASGILSSLTHENKFISTTTEATKATDGL